MPEIRAFRGWRYNPAVVGELSGVIAPPYDVLDQQAVRELLGRSPYNVVRLELPTVVSTLQGEDGRQAYRQAAALLRKWTKEHVLVEEPEPALYLYRQHFSMDSARLTRTGVFAILRLEAFSQGIYPHEETLPAPKADRLALLQQVRANISPIFGVHDDTQGTTLVPLEEAVRGQPPLTAMDPDNGVHELWPVYDEDCINQVASAIAHHNILIADGHHRYETALAYRDRLKQELGKEWSEEHPANFVLICLVPAGDPGLVIWPTHRLLELNGGLGMSELTERVSPLFSLEVVGHGVSAARECWKIVTNDSSRLAIGIGTARDRAWAVVRPVDPDCVCRIRPDRSRAWCRLAVNLVHEALLPEVVGTEGIRRVSYEHDVEVVARRVHEGRAQLAVLVPPPSIEEFVEISLQGERMPAKSTYFYPKVPTGLVLYRHER